ncbi:FMRFamide receptor-like [Liolophura sinensis]|uniref:FMRFamide receptor-like n=1 Tax=Liolophura sinensis TaxID=3198878 RepID=UPI0031583A07
MEGNSSGNTYLVLDENSSDSYDDTGNTFQFYAWGIMANFVSVLGLIGNILSIIVLSDRRMRSPTSCYLISLAVYDSVVLLSMCLSLAIPTLKYKTNLLDDYFKFYPYMHVYAYPIALIAQTGTIYTTVGFTIERYIAVCRPLHAAEMCTISRAKKVILVIFICIVLYNVPRMMEHRVLEQWDNVTNTTTAQIIPTDLGNDQVYKTIYFIYLHLFIMFLVPFSLLFVLNLLLIRAVRKSRQTRQEMSASRAKEHNLTVMLIAVIAAFLICQLPSIADNILFVVGVPFNLDYIRFTTISNLMVVTNSATNFILYCVFGKKFRKVFFRIFGCQKCHSEMKKRGSLMTRTRWTSRLTESTKMQ